ncbi:MAG: tetratricopeptide repeat protein [Deltaproteobacteria bacterium]|nr:tetratricopeptide repeat protein [Deltaproteobacteria bacterium]
MARPSDDAPCSALRVELPALDFDGGIGTEFFSTLARVRVERSAAAAPRSLACRGLREARGYTRAELFAIAEIGYHYLLNGGVRLAHVIFEGLVAVAPEEAYFALALGLTLDRQERIDEAASAYRRAAELDPADGRADVNLAELLLLGGDEAGARAHLDRARQKATAGGDQALAKKATALLTRLRSHSERTTR